jgi:phosphatidylserine synthase
VKKSTFIGAFILVSYFLLFIGIAWGLPIALASSILLIVMNLIAFVFTLPPEYSQRKAVYLFIRSIAAGKGSFIHDYPRMSHKTINMLIMGAASTLAMIALVLLIDALIAPLPDLEYSMLVCLLLGMLTIRMQIASELEGEDSARL